MAVYTDVSGEDLAAFLARYDIGELLSYKGIAEGVENSNYVVHTSRGYLFLTLYEKPVTAFDHPFFPSLMYIVLEQRVVHAACTSLTYLCRHTCLRPSPMPPVSPKTVSFPAPGFRIYSLLFRLHRYARL